MKRILAVGLCLGGTVALFLLLPAYDAAQPHGLSVTRAGARRVADAEARKLGIPVEKAWVDVVWEGSGVLEGELSRDPAARRRASSDPVLGPRLGGFVVTYFRRGQEKFPDYGFVHVARDGAVTSARRRARAEEGGGHPALEALRAEADRFVASRAFPGAPGPVYESVRPNVLSARTDHLFRYRVDHPATPPGVRLLLNVAFVGDRLAGWQLSEEYADGRAFKYEMGEDIVGSIVRFALLYVLLAVLLAIFLRKYHAGEVGVGIGAWLFAVTLGGLAVTDVLTAQMLGHGTGMGGTDALGTAAATAAFKLLFFDVPFALLVSLGWSVGESFARERWGQRLASFDALVRRDGVNATVGGSILTGLLAAPAVAAAAYLLPWPALAAGLLTPRLGEETQFVLGAVGGPIASILGAAMSALVVSVPGLLFGLGATRRVRGVSLLPAGLLFAGLLGSGLGVGRAPVGPAGWAFLLGIGMPLAAAAVFFARDLLAAATSVFVGSLLFGLLPLARVLEGTARTGVVVAMAVPLAVLLALAAAGLASGREVSYSYEDLAPHVRRIVERERVKAEIEAANRIQAALLPSRDPRLSGASVASHYGAATEIGGDYYDFLPLGDGRLGLAFGDVAGHGLTSGILMAMAKSALLVQAEYDVAPRRVLEVLNDHVLRTAPKRMLMTFFFGVLDLGTGELRYASAGHLDPYVYRAGAGRLEPLSAWGFPLGVKRRDPFGEHVAVLSPGDRLVLYSDGLIEAADDDGEPFGFERFERVLSAAGLRSAEEIRRDVLAAVRRFTRNRPPEDDQTLVVLAYEGLAAAAA